MKILEKMKKRENREEQAHAHPSTQLPCENGGTLFFRKLLNFLRKGGPFSVYIPVRASHTLLWVRLRLEKRHLHTIFKELPGDSVVPSNRPSGTSFSESQV